MKSAPKHSLQSPDYRGLSTEELLVLIAEKDAKIEAACSEKIAAEDQMAAAVLARDKRIKSQERIIKLLEEQLRLARIRKFAASSEKLPFQIGLFDEAELEVSLTELDEQIAEEEPPARPRPKTRNRGFAEDLPRKRIELRLSEAEKIGASKTFFTKVKEELEYIPAQLNVLEYWQEKAVFDADGEERIVAATRPVHPLNKCFAHISLLAYIIVAKYADGLPLYRLEGILKRGGNAVSRTNMAHWVIRLEDVFKPLIHLIRESQNSGRYLNADETRIQVLKEDGRRAQTDKWMWVTCGGPPGQPSVLFEYDPSRAGAVPERLLTDFKGILQADGYTGYAGICRQNKLARIGCWDHARRKFVEAVRASDPKAKKAKGKPSKAEVAVGKIRQLYRIESAIADDSEAQKYRKRQELAVPVLNDLKAWLEKNVSKVLKGSQTRVAMEYTLNQWEYLIGYCEHGYLNISNAKAENAVRPFAVGRKAWLFADTAHGARASAICYSLIETAKANQLEPYAYILYVLEHIGSADTVEALEALLPWNVPLETFSKKVPAYGKGK